MATMVIFILVLLFGPSVISLPFVAMFFSDKEIKVSKSLLMLYIGIMIVLTLVWDLFSQLKLMVRQFILTYNKN